MGIEGLSKYCSLEFWGFYVFVRIFSLLLKATSPWVNEMRLPRSVRNSSEVATNVQIVNYSKINLQLKKTKKILGTILTLY